MLKAEYVEKPSGSLCGRIGWDGYLLSHPKPGGMRKIYAPDDEDGCDADGKGKESDVCGTTRGWAWGRPDRAIRNWSTPHSNQYGTSPSIYTAAIY